MKTNTEIQKFVHNPLDRVELVEDSSSEARVYFYASSEDIERRYLAVLVLHVDVEENTALVCQSGTLLTNNWTRRACACGRALSFLRESGLKDYR